MKSILAAVCVVFIFAIIPTASGIFNNDIESYLNQGRACIVFRPGSGPAEQFCQSCSYSNVELCFRSLLGSLNLIQICSTNSTNSTIPANSCVFCQGINNQVASCVGTATIASGTLVSDANFLCLELTCSARIDFKFDGEKLIVRRNLLGKRDVSSSNEDVLKVPVRQYFDFPKDIGSTVYVELVEEL